MNVVIQSQERKSLALVVTPEGVEVRVPQQLDPAGERVQQFIANGLARLPKDLELERERPYQTAEIQTKIDTWAEKLGVTVNRVQIRPMRRKWGRQLRHEPGGLYRRAAALDAAVGDRYRLVFEEGGPDHRAARN